MTTSDATRVDVVDALRRRFVALLDLFHRSRPCSCEDCERMRRGWDSPTEWSPGNRREG